VRKSNFALRLQPSLLDEARQVAEAEGVALNQLINIAVAEKLSALRTETHFAERASRASVPRAPDILKRAGVGNPPRKDDRVGPTKKRTLRSRTARKADQAKP
jgi:hypothetical protein